MDGEVAVWVEAVDEPGAVRMRRRQEPAATRPSGWTSTLERWLKTEGRQGHLGGGRRAQRPSFWRGSRRRAESWPVRGEVRGCHDGGRACPGERRRARRRRSDRGESGGDVAPRWPQGCSSRARPSTDSPPPPRRARREQLVQEGLDLCGPGSGMIAPPEAEGRQKRCRRCRRWAQARR